MTRRAFAVIAAGMIVAAACSGGSGATDDTADDGGSQEAPSSTTPSTTSTTLAGDRVFYEDPADDCLNGITNLPAPSCMPAPTDILSVEITRESPLTIVIEIADPGEPSLGESYQFTIGLDLDLDITTGILNPWPERHGMAPNLETDYFGPKDDHFVQAYAIPGQEDYQRLEPPPVTWAWVDETHIEATFHDGAVPEAVFGVAIDFYTGNYYDAFPDGGYLEFPSGDVVLVTG